VLTCTSIVTMIQDPCQWNPELRGVGKDCEEKTAKIRCCFDLLCTKQVPDFLAKAQDVSMT
jgi:hypothetical protein